MSPDGWITATLNSVCEVIPGQSPKGSEINTAGKGVEFYQGARDFGERWPETRTFTTNPARMAEAGDVLLSVRAPVGRINRARRACSIGRGVMALRAKATCDPDFLEYLARSLQGVWGAYESGGSVFTNLGRQALASVRIRYPDLRQQSAIARVLGALDDKVDCNRRLAESANALARSIFETAANGERQPLAGVADVVMGSSPPGHTYNESEEGLPFFQGIRDFGFRHPTSRVWCSVPKRTAARGDVLVSVRAPVGRINAASEHCCIGRGLAAIRSEAQPSTLFHALRSAEDVWAPFEGEGTVFGAINRPQLEQTLVPWPEAEDAVELEQRLQPLDHRVSVAIRENSALAALRDALLPKLMSGEVSVREVEEMAAAVN